MPEITITMVVWFVVGCFASLIFGALTAAIVVGLCAAARCGDCAIEQQRNADPVDHGFPEGEKPAS